MITMSSEVCNAVMASYQNCWRGWPLPGSWPCQLALCPDRNVGISAAPASLCRWCGRLSVEENAHKHTRYKLVACESFEYLSSDWELASTSPACLLESAGPEAQEVWKTVCGALMQVWIISKHPALPLHASKFIYLLDVGILQMLGNILCDLWGGTHTVCANTNWWRGAQVSSCSSLKSSLRGEGASRD